MRWGLILFKSIKEFYRTWNTLFLLDSNDFRQLLSVRAGGNAPFQHAHRTSLSLETHTADVAAFDRCQRAPTWTKTGTNYTQLVQCSCHTDSVALPCWSCGASVVAGGCSRSGDGPGTDNKLRTLGPRNGPMKCIKQQ